VSRPGAAIAGIRSRRPPTLASFPYPHFHMKRFFPAALCGRLRRTLVEMGGWKASDAAFYEMAQLRLRPERLDRDLAWLVEEPFLDGLRALMGEVFATTLSTEVALDAHAMSPGQRIGVHNDWRPGRETHRLVVFLNAEWTPEDGGLLMLFEGPTADQVTSAAAPVCGDAFGFEISPTSYHGVSPVVRETRWTLVYSFRRAES